MANPLDLVAFAKRAWEEAQSEWNKTSQPLKERATILPFGQYEDGSVGLAWPGLLAAPAEGMVNFGRYGYDTPEAIRDNAASAFDVAGGAVTGGLGVGLAGGLADDAVRAALPMNEAARLARARGLGFDTDNVWYHGSPHTFDEFEIGPNRVGTGGGDPYQPMSELGAFFTQDPEIAALYGPNVRQFYVRGEYPELYNPVANKPEAVDTIDQTAADMRQLLSRGYDGAKLTGPGTEPELAVFNPTNIRSVDAAFDPAMSGSANIFAANAPTGSSVPLAVNALERSGAQPRPQPYKINPTAEHQPGVFEADVLRDGSPIGSARYSIDGDTAQIHLLRALSGSNSLGVGDIRAMREAFRELYPDVKRFQGYRDVDMKTGNALKGADNAGYPEDRWQSFDFYSNPKTSAAVPLLQNALERAQPQGIRAYHGSPHDFDRFSLDKIGTGEGAQAYGHGLYFAESEGVAKSYRDALAPTTVDGNQYSSRTPEGVAAQAFEFSKGDIDKVREYLISNQSFAGHSDEIRRLHGDALALVNSGYVPNVERQPGRMYEVNIRANPEDFLDWDKPLSQQSEAVRNALIEKAKEAAARGSFPKADTTILENLLAKDVPASEFYTRNRNVFGRAEDASQALREAGIPGIRYLDGNSRGAGEGSSNYVVFDDQLIDILRKYANAPTASAVPLAGETQDTELALEQYLRMIGL